MSKKRAESASSARVLRSAKRAGTGNASWASLPAEIRFMILDELSRPKHRGWTSCAAVSKEWQAFVEPRNFRRLRLQPSCARELGRMVVRQRGLVRHICLSIELRRYTCRSCQKTESYSWMTRDAALTRDAILKLFSVLSAWEPAGRLVLELNAYSPSDSEHWFKNYHFGLPHEDDGDSVHQQQEVTTATTKRHDPSHGWVNGQQVEAPRTLAILRIFSPLCLSLPETLPEVRAVTGFVMRRQLRRQISPEALQRLWQRLPRLESVVYEPWRVWRHSWKVVTDRDLASAVRDALPSHVSTVSVFEDFNDQLVSALRSDTLYLELVNTNPTAAPPLVSAFASRSLDLEHLSISYMIDARNFFDACRPSYSWHRLQSLTLTSSTLTPSAPKREIFTLLCSAGLAALNMPQLERLVLWNSRNGHACAVTYHREKASGHAILTWRGTWDLELSCDVVESWQKVSSDSHHLRIMNERVEGVINSHGDAIYHLRLPSGVIDPASMRQIRQEGMMQRVA